MAKSTRTQTGHHVDFEEAPKSDFQRLVEHVQENPLMYAAGAAFVLACLVAGGLYRLNRDARLRDAGSRIGAAMETENVAVRANELEAAAAAAGPLAPEALYLAGEAAYEAGDYEAAEQAFERLRAEYPRAAKTPDAVEGLGYIAENREDHETALGLYREVLENWPDSFAGRRQEFNIGRVQEQLGNIGEAAGAYETQVGMFPNSYVAAQARAALDRLKLRHPGMFPEETPPAPAPEEPEAVPEEPEAVPEEPEAVPEEPEVVPEEPEAVPEEPVAVTEEPVAVTEEPVAGTEEPVARTEEPVAGTEEPPAPAE